MMHISEKQKNIFYYTFLAVIALISFFGLAEYVTSFSFTQSSIQYLASKQNNVFALAATSTAASTVVTLLPGDIASPLANQLADINKYAFVVLLAIFIEKYLVNISGFVLFKFVVPGVCLALGLNSWFLHSDFLKRFVLKILLFFFVVFSIVPLSVQASKLLETTQKISIEQTIQQADRTTQKVEENVRDSSSEQNFWDKTVSFFKKGIDGVTSQVNSLLHGFTQTLNNLLEAVVLLVITSCVIPLAVMFLLFWLAKLLFTSKAFTSPHLEKRKKEYKK